jgi:hypothetical protein
MNRPYNNHGEEGYNIFINNDFGVDEKYIPIIAETILHHQNHHTQSKLNYRFDKGLENLRIDDVATGNVLLNDAEWEIASLIVQLVADIDKCDILYQHLSDDFDMIRDYVYDRSNVRQKRKENEIGISAVRGGTIVGDHEVIYAGEDEEIVIKHTAHSRNVFAKGALEAGKFLAGTTKGMYSMQDVVGK